MGGSEEISEAQTVMMSAERTGRVTELFEGNGLKVFESDIQWSVGRK